MSVTGTCASRSRWSGTRALAAKASLVGGIAVSAWLGTVAFASAAPAVEPAVVNLSAISSESADQEIFDEPDQLVEPAAPSVPATSPGPVRPAEPATPAPPGTPVVQVNPAQPVEPSEPASPQVGKPAQVSIAPPDRPAFTSPMLVDTASELLGTPPEAPEPPAAPAPVPAPREAVDDATPNAKTDHDNTGRSPATTAPVPQAVQSPPPPPPPAPATDQPPNEPAPVQLPPVPTMSAAGAAPGASSGHRQLAILPTTTPDPGSRTSVSGHAESFSLSDVVPLEPSTSPD